MMGPRYGPPTARPSPRSCAGRAMVVAPGRLDLADRRSLSSRSRPGPGRLALVAPALDPLSPVAQIASAFSLLTWPGVVYVAMAGIALWAFRRRLRQLAVALVLMIVARLGASPSCSRSAFGRARPEPGLDLIGIDRLRVPVRAHEHIVASGIAVGATFAVTRQTRRDPAAVADRRGAARHRGRGRPLDPRGPLCHRHRRRRAARRPDRDPRAAGQRGRGAGGARAGHRDDAAASRRAGAASGGSVPR